MMQSYWKSRVSQVTSSALVLDFDGHSPILAEDCFLAPGAVVIGRTTIGSRSSVWFNAVVRGDSDAIEIGDRTNIQDSAVLHVDPGFPLRIGNDVTVGHAAVVHGATIGDGCTIGMGATVLTGAIIGAGAIVAAGAVVREGDVIPDNALVAGVPAVVKRDLGPDKDGTRIHGADHYHALSAVYRALLGKRTE